MKQFICSGISSTVKGARVTSVLASGRKCARNVNNTCLHVYYVCIWQMNGLLLRNMRQNESHRRRHERREPSKTELILFFHNIIYF